MHQVPRISRRRALGWMAAAGVAGCSAGDPRHVAKQPVMKRNLPDEVNGCRLSPERFVTISSCVDHPLSQLPGDEWKNNCLHPNTGVYTCGRIVRPGEPNVHDHDPDEIVRCRKLADEAAEFVKNESGLGCEGGNTHAPFYVVANRGDETPEAFTPQTVRRLFGGAIYPAAVIEIDPMIEGGKWWQKILVEYGFEPDGSTPDPNYHDEYAPNIERWRSLAHWFAQQDELHAPSYIEIGDNTMSRTNLCCVFPRLNVGLTRAGSVVGTFVPVVHT